MLGNENLSCYKNRRLINYDTAPKTTDLAGKFMDLWKREGKKQISGTFTRENFSTVNWFRQEDALFCGPKFGRCVYSIEK